MILDDIEKAKDRELNALVDQRKGLADQYFEKDEPQGFQGQGLIYGDVPPDLKASEYLKSAQGWVYACVSVIADAIARNPIGLYKVNSSGDIEAVDSHAALDVLDKVNDFTTRYDHINLSQQYLELAGEAPWFMDRGNDGNLEPRGIWLLRPDCLSIEQSKEGAGLNPIGGYKYRVDASKTINIKPEEMVFLKYPDANNPWRGRGTLAAAARAYDLDVYAEDYNKAFFANSGRPDMLLATEQKLTDKQKTGLRSDLNRLYRGRKNAHKTMILESGLKAEPFAISQKDMEFLEQSKFSRDKIFSIFRVHKSVVAVTDDVNLANAKVGEYVFAKWTIKPKLERIVAQLNEFYLPMFNGTEKMFFAFDDPVPQDVDTKLKRYDSALAKGWMTLNEVRAEENLPDGGELADQILVPNSLTTLERVGQNPLESTNALGFKVKKPFTKKMSRYEEDGVKARSAGGYQKVMLRIKQSEIERKKIQEANKEVHRGIKAIAKVAVKQLIAEKKEAKKRSIEEYVNVYLKAADKHERVFYTASIAIFENQKEKILKRMGKKKVKEVVLDDYLLDEEDEAQVMVEVYNPLIKRVVKERGDRAAKLVGAKFSLQTQPVQEYLSNRAYEFSFEINETTNEILGKSLAEGIADGESIPQLRKRVEEVFDGMEKYRSERIARTEVIKGSNFAADEAYKQSGLVDKVQWLATPDDRLDPDCADLDGKIINLGSSFSSGVEYPPLHPNCRCTIIPIVN